MTLPDHPGASSPTPQGHSPATRAPGLISYGDVVDRVGFEIVPEELVAELTRSGVLGGELWAGGAESPVARRRKDGSYYQHIAAWWASEQRFVRFDATRALVMGDDGKLRPTSAWGASGSIRDFPSRIVPTRSTWRYEVANLVPESGRRPPRPEATHTLDVLPRLVTRPLAGGTSDAWQKTRRGWACEEIMACNVTGGRVHLLRARREATSRRALESANWVTETVDSECGVALLFSCHLQR